jgi:glycosyltransferase involved in cell wall biosynthesis
MKKEGAPLVSVVLLNYNGLKYLKEVIPSILKQNYPNFEFIIIDNGSKDGSLEFIKKFKKIILLNGPKEGYKNIACNYAIKNANGEYILLLDEDILIPNNNYLMNLKNYFLSLEKNEKIGFISPLLIDAGETLTKYYGLYFALYGKKINPAVDINKILKSKNKIEIAGFHGGAIFFRKCVWNYLGGYDSDYRFGMCDYDLGLRSCIFGYKNYIYKNKLIHLGKAKDENKKHFAKKFSHYYEGIATTILKNYSKKNLFLSYFSFLLYVLMINTGLILTKKNLFLLRSPISATSNFFKRIRKTIQKRKKIQSTRIIKKDNFLKIKPPKFN